VLLFLFFSQQKIETKISVIFLFFFALFFATYLTIKLEKDVPQLLYGYAGISALFYLGYALKLHKTSTTPIVRKRTQFSVVDLLVLTGCITIFVLAATHHLGQFMSVDEPKWLEIRVPQL